MSLHNGFLLLVAATLLVSVAQGGVIVDVSLSGSPGAYSYSYEIENQTAAGIFAFSLTVTGDVGSIQSPTGWNVVTGVPSPGETLVQWVDLDVPYDVPAFGTLSGFQIASGSGPGTSAFSMLDENFTEFDGQTSGPAASSVPEPQTLLLAVSALAGLLVLRKVHSHRPRPFQSRPNTI
jgi:hypothetical protein